MTLTNISIGKRLALVLGTILLLCLASSLFAIAQLRKMSTDVQRMVDQQLAAERLANDWYLHVYGGVQRATAIARSNDAGLSDYFAPATADSVRETTAIQQQAETLMTGTDQKALLERIARQRQLYLNTQGEVLRREKAGDAQGALTEFTQHFEPESKAYMDIVQELAKLQRRQLDASAEQVAAMSTQTRLMLAVAAASALGLGLLLAYLLTRSITTPLREAEAMATAIADMDLSGQARTAYTTDETGRLLKALDRMREALHGALGRVRAAAENVSTASTQIASGNADLSARTEQAASNLQETAGAMEQLTGTVRNTADSARTAAQLVDSASAAAMQGGDVVKRVVATMGEISTASGRIADIIGTIDGIAFQTNILALNAAVEAARAGEQGRGFAVVAGEVRVLAKRSADAAREIKSLIGNSTDRVEHGVQLVEQAGSAMGDIVASVRRVTDIIGEITAASGEQSQGIGEVNTAVIQLDQMTQQNAALVEESSAAADSLRDQAVLLTDVVGGFKLA